MYDYWLYLQIFFNIKSSEAFFSYLKISPSWQLYDLYDLGLYLNVSLSYLCARTKTVPAPMWKGNTATVDVITESLGWVRQWADNKTLWSDAFYSTKAACPRYVKIPLLELDQNILGALVVGVFLMHWFILSIVFFFWRNNMILYSSCTVEMNSYNEYLDLQLIYPE